MEMTLKDIMKTDVVAQPEDVSIEEAALIMTHTTIGAVLVVDNNNKPIGILTERDIITKVIGKHTPKYSQLRDSMSKDIITLSADASVIKAAKLMDAKQIRHIVVTSPEGTLQGIVSIRDTNQALLKMIQQTL